MSLANPPRLNYKPAGCGETESDMPITDRQQAADTTQPEQEPESKRVQTPENDDALSVISSNVSLHDSDFDFSPLDFDKNFTLLTPPPHRRIFANFSKDSSGKLSTPSPVYVSNSSTMSSPSQYMKSSEPTIATSIGKEKQTVKTPQRRSNVPNSKRSFTTMHEKIPSAGQEKEMAAKRYKAEDKAQSRAVTATIPQQHVSQQLESIHCCKQEVHACQSAHDAIKSVAITSGRVEIDQASLPSGLVRCPSEQDSFFSYVNSLSSEDDFDTPVMSMRLSPSLSCSSYNLPKLLPPFPENEQRQSFDANNDNDISDDATLIRSLPTIQAKETPSFLVAGSFAGEYKSGFNCASKIVSPKLINAYLPNIQASTRATPGKTERSKLAGHSVMKLKLHTSCEASPSLLYSHTTRDLQAINKSLKRERHMCRRTANTENFSTITIQRKLLQSPNKLATSKRLTRSPLQQWNGQTPTGNELPNSCTHVSNEKASARLALRMTKNTSLLSPLPQSPQAGQIVALTTRKYTKKKRKATQNVSTKAIKSSATTRLQAITLAKQVKRKGTTSTSDKLTSLTPLASDAAIRATFESHTFQTPLSVDSVTALKMSLPSASQYSHQCAVIPPLNPRKAPCNCKKSKCLKFYCECFASGGYCDANCNCLNCSNTTKTESLRQHAIALRLEKNPKAFQPKIGTKPFGMTAGNANCLVVKVSEGIGTSSRVLLSPPNQQRCRHQQLLISRNVSTKVHKHGCHCKKSACQKKYCECFQAGVICGENCRCIECKNQAYVRNEANTSSRLNETPYNELKETLASRVFTGIRKRMRVDGRAWKEDFTLPFKTQSGYDRRDRESKDVDGLERILVHGQVTAMPCTSPCTPPQVTRRNDVKRSYVSPGRGEGERKRTAGSGAKYSSLVLKEYDSFRGNPGDCSDMRSSRRVKRVFVLPLFGQDLVPLKIDISAKIFGFLTNTDLHNASFVSRLWNQVALGDIVWDHANFIPKKVKTGNRWQQKTHQRMPPVKSE